MTKRFHVLGDTHTNRDGAREPVVINELSAVSLARNLRLPTQNSDLVERAIRSLPVGGLFLSRVTIVRLLDDVDADAVPGTTSKTNRFETS